MKDMKEKKRSKEEIKLGVVDILTELLSKDHTQAEIDELLKTFPEDRIKKERRKKK